LQQQALAALGQAGDPRTPDLILKAWPPLSPERRSQALDIMLGREPWCLSLLAAVREGRVPRPDIDTARQVRLRENKAPAVRDQALALLPVTSLSNRAEIVTRYKPALALEADRERGRVVFEKTCMACHQLQGKGLSIGPDIRSAKGHTPDKLLASILDPSADIQPGFSAYEAILHSGEQLQGFIAAEYATGLQLRMLSGETRNLSRADIKSLKSLGKSLMPEGLDSVVNLQDMADLLAFLKNLPPE
jgi:putative heme-binding domain-containing protein